MDTLRSAYAPFLFTTSFFSIATDIITETDTLRSDAHLSIDKNVRFCITDRRLRVNHSYVCSLTANKLPLTMHMLAHRCLPMLPQQLVSQTATKLSTHVVTMGPGNEVMPIPPACHDCNNGVQFMVWIAHDKGTTLIWINKDGGNQTQTLENGGVYIGI